MFVILSRPHPIPHTYPTSHDPFALPANASSSSFPTNHYNKSKKIAFGNKERTTDKKMGILVLLRLHKQQWSLQHCLRPLAFTWAELYFQRFHNGPNDPKGNKI